MSDFVAAQSGHPAPWPGHQTDVFEADALAPRAEERAEFGGLAATDLYAEIYGERARQTTVVLVVLVDEDDDGGWGVAGNVLTAAMLNGDA